MDRSFETIVQGLRDGAPQPREAGPALRGTLHSVFPARSDLPQYRERALFEAVVNAVVHRDYRMRGSRIRLSMFDDRLEIQSPGSLPNNLTVKRIAAKQSTRNAALISVLARMPVEGTRGSGKRILFMESRGDGVRIIKQETWELSGKYSESRIVKTGMEGFKPTRIDNSVRQEKWRSQGLI